MSPKSSIIFVNFTTWNLQKKKKLKSSLKQSQVSSAVCWTDQIVSNRMLFLDNMWRCLLNENQSSVHFNEWFKQMTTITKITV